MDGIDVFLLFIIAIFVVTMFVQAVLATKDQARALKAGEPVGTLWQHMVKRGRQSRTALPGKPGGSGRPKPLSAAQRKALNLKPAKQTFFSAGQPKQRHSISPPTRAIRDGWRIADVQFTYQDAEGELTARRVTVHSVDATYIKGECHERQAERTFRIDRVVGEVLDLDTGELLSARKWARNFS